MTIETCMELVDGMLPNRIPHGVKLRFLGEAEGKVRVELLGQEPPAQPIFREDTPTNTELSAPHPYDQLYWQYLLAMLSQLCGDITRYENAAVLFNATYQSFGKWLKRRGA
jgi:hypothetical protein